MSNSRHPRSTWFRRGLMVAVVLAASLATVISGQPARASTGVTPAACTTTVCHTLNGRDTISDLFACDSITVTHYYGAGARNPNRIALTKVTFRNPSAWHFTIQPYLQDSRQQVVRPNTTNGQIIVAAGTTYTWTINRTLYMTFFTELRYTAAFGCGGHSNITWNPGPAL